MNETKWLNIPLPLIDAFQTIKKTFGNFENLFLAEMKEHKTRSENIAKKLKQLEKKNDDAIVTVKRASDLGLKSNLDKI